MAVVSNYQTSTGFPASFPFTPVSQVVPRKRVHASIKTVDGQALSGVLYFRISTSNVQDGLNQTEDRFVALTDVIDPSGQVDDYTFLVNFAQIVYVALPQTGLSNELLALPTQDQLRPSRKIPVMIRTVTGDHFSGTMFVRNTLSRAKDEVNLKDGQFIALMDVTNAQPGSPSQVYLINKSHISFLAVKNIPEQ
jgi:hypothetical protein